MSESFEEARVKMAAAAELRQWRDLDPKTREASPSDVLRENHGTNGFKADGTSVYREIGDDSSEEGISATASFAAPKEMQPQSHPTGTDAEIKAAVQAAIAEANLEG